MSFRSIGVRLAVWYSLVLAAGLLLFAVSVWGLLRYSLHRDVEQSLSAQLASAERFLEAELSATDFNDEWEEYARAIAPGALLEIRGPSGHRLAAHPVALPPTFTGDDRQARSSFTWKGEMYRVGSARVTVHAQPYTIIAAESLQLADELSRRLLWLLAIVFVPLLVLAGAGGYFLSRRALSPVTELSRQAESLSVDNLSLRLAVAPTGDELQQLGETWNRMLARLERAVTRLTQFTADASHELRTPLALIRTTAELSLRRERAPEAYREALRSIQVEAERTTELVEDLLSLARADAGRSAVPLMVLDLCTVVSEAVAQQAPTAQLRSIDLKQKLPGRLLLIKGNAPALRRLVLIPLDNALKYTPHNGEVTVVVDNNKATADLLVRDTGVGIPCDMQPHIFERFYRADPSRHDAGGHGLGLSIAQWIAQCHATRIEVDSSPGQGSTFRLAFSLAEQSGSVGLSAPSPVAGAEPPAASAATRLLKPH